MQPHHARAFASLLLLSSAASAAAQADEPDLVVASKTSPLQVAVYERVLGFDDPQMSTDEPLWSPDGQHMAYIVVSGGTFAVVRDGVEGDSFRGIVTDSLQFSSNSEHLCYLAMTDEGKKYVVLDDQQFEQFELHGAGVVFSPDGERFAWVAGTESHDWHAVVDGEVGAPYDGVTPRGVVFSPDSAHHAYVANLDGLQAVVRDGAEGPFLDDVVDFVWSPSGEHLTYVARQGEKLFVFHDDEPVAEVDAIGSDGIVYAKDADRWVLAVRVGSVWHLLVDGELRGEYKNLLPGISISDDGRRVAFMAGKGEGLLLVLDGEEFSDYVAYEQLSFAAGGQHVGLVAIEPDGRRVVLIDGEEQHRFQSVAPPGVVFSSSGEHHFYVGQRPERFFVVYDGELGTPARRFGSVKPHFAEGDRLVYSLRKKDGEVLVIDGVDQKPYDGIRGLAFSADGSRCAYFGGEDGAWTLVVDGEERGSYPFVSGAATFSPDGARLAFVSGRDGKSFVVVDGEPGPEFDYVGKNSLVFTPDSAHIAYCAAIADRRYVVVDDVVVDNGYTGFLRTEGILWRDDQNLAVRAARRGVWLLLELELL